MQLKLQFPLEVHLSSSLLLNSNNRSHYPHNYRGTLSSLWSVIQSASSQIGDAMTQQQCPWSGKVEGTLKEAQIFCVCNRK